MVIERSGMKKLLAGRWISSVLSRLCFRGWGLSVQEDNSDSLIYSDRCERWMEESDMHSCVSSEYQCCGKPCDMITDYTNLVLEWGNNFTFSEWYLILFSPIGSKVRRLKIIPGVALCVCVLQCGTQRR